MALTSVDTIVAAMTGAQRKKIKKKSAVSKGAGYYHSLWKEGSNPAAGSTPAAGNGAIPTSATTGALPFTDPAAGELTYLDKLIATSTVAGVACLIDRLWHNSGLSGTSIVAQTFTQPALTRHTDGLGNELWLEVYTAFGATNTVFTITYTNEAGVAGKTAVLAYTGGAPVAGQMIGPFPLASGDKGVISVQSVTLSISTAAVGDFGVVLLHPLTEVACPAANVAVLNDVVQSAHPSVEDSACIALMVLCSTTSTGDLDFPSFVMNQG